MSKTLFCAVILCVALCGCGRKPSGLLAPEGAMANAYPQVYPRPLPGESEPQTPQQDEVAKYKARPDPSLQ